MRLLPSTVIALPIPFLNVQFLNVVLAALSRCTVLLLKASSGSHFEVGAEFIKEQFMILVSNWGDKLEAKNVSGLLNIVTKTACPSLQD